MKVIFKYKALLLSTMLVTACGQSSLVSGTDDVPVWVYSEPVMYSNAKYLSATGSASKMEQAKARALSNLAKIFEVHIRDVSTVRQDVQTHSQDDVETMKKTQRVASTVNLKTNKVMEGVRIAEQWYNSKDITYHALAVLDRAQAENTIRREMNRLDEETQFFLNQQEKRDDILLKISDLHKANTLQKERQSLQKNLKIIDVNGKGMFSLWNMAALNERLQDALRAVPIEAIARADDMSELAGILQGAVAKAGFDIKKNGKENSYQLVANLEQEESIKRDSWYWLRATLKLELIAQDGSTVIGYQTWPLKVTAGERSQLQARMYKAVNEKLDDELLNSVLQFVI